MSLENWVSLQSNLWLAERFNVARLMYASLCILVLKNVLSGRHEVQLQMRGRNVFHLERQKLLLSFVCWYLFTSFSLSFSQIEKSLFAWWQAGFNLTEESSTAFTSKTQSGLWHILTEGPFRWIILRSYITVNISLCANRPGLFFHDHTVECLCTHPGCVLLYSPCAPPESRLMVDENSENISS